MRGKATNLAYYSNIFNNLSNLYEPHKINSLGIANLLSYRLFSSNDRQFRNNGRRDDFNARKNDYGNSGSNPVRPMRGERQRPDFGGPNVLESGDFRSRGRRNDGFDKPFRTDESRGGGDFRREGRRNEGFDKPFGRDESRGGGDFRGQGRRNDGFDKPFGRDESRGGGDFRREGRRSDGFDKPFGRDESRGGVKFGDDLLNFDESEGGGEGRKNYQPSVRELLNAPSEGEGNGKKVGENFLAKFRLGSEDKEEEKEKESSETNEAPSVEEEKMEVPEGADEIFKKMKQSGLIPNAVAMLDGLCKDGLVQEAMKLFGLMREKGSMPEVIVYTAVVEGFCKAQRFDDAKRIFKKMQSNGIVPNAYSYTVLIKGLSKGKILDDALDFCSEMVEGGHSPNVQTFTGLVHEFCNEKGVEEARKVIITLKQKGFLLDEKAVRVHLDKSGPTSPMVWEAIFGPKKTAQRTA